jgi:hypothetical protein
MWTVVRIPIGGPIDEDSSRPFLPLGAAVPLLNGVQWRKGSVLPWREAVSTSDDLDIASRRFGGMLVNYGILETSEIHLVDGETREALIPGSVIRIADHWKTVRGAPLEQVGVRGWVDSCETDNWIVTVYWNATTMRITATHKSTGYTLERRDPTVSQNNCDVWPRPRVLRDNTKTDAFVVSYVQTDVANTQPTLSVGKYSMARYSISTSGGIYVGDTYTELVYAKSLPGSGAGPNNPFHDAREVDAGVFVAAYANDTPSAYGLVLVHVDASFNRTPTTVSYADRYPTAFGAMTSGSAVVAAYAFCDGGSTTVGRRSFDGSWVQRNPLPVPYNIVSRVVNSAIGAHPEGGWRMIFGMHIIGCTEETNPVMTHKARWGEGGSGVLDTDSWLQASVPFYSRNTWHYLLQQGNHTVIAAEYGSGAYHEGEFGAVNEWRLVPVARVATWITSNKNPWGMYPRRLHDDPAKYLFPVRTQVSSDCDVDVYVISTSAPSELWEHDTIGVGPSTEACAGLLLSPDTTTVEAGFVFSPVITDTTTGNQTYNIALQWERVGKDGEIHRSFPSAYTVTGSFKVGTLLTRASGDIRLLVWSTDSAGIYRLIHTEYVDPYQEKTDWIVPHTGVNEQIAPWYGQLAHGPAPSPWHACVHGNRVWLISAEDRYSVWPSLLLHDVLAAPVFPAALAIVAHDDKLHRLYSTDVGVVVLGSKHIYIARGDGPDNTGNGAPFELYSVPGAVGCSGQACQTPWGVMYATTDGIALLDRGVSVHMVSDQVREKIKGKTVRSMAYWPSLQRAVVLYDGFMLLWHPERGWSTIPIDDAAAVRVATDTGNLEVLFYNRTAAQYHPLNEQCATTGLAVSTAWLDASVQPWIRIRKVRVRARRVNSPVTATQITINIYANGNDWYPAESRHFTIDDMQGAGNALYFTPRLSRQKYETIRVEIRTVGSVPLEWEWVELEFMMRRGTAKIGSAIGV